MSISQIESKIKSLQRDIEKLGRDLEAETKKEANFISSIARTKRSITKNASLSSLRTKEKSMSSDAEKADKSSKKQAELQEKIAKKKIELAKQQAALQKERDRAFNEMSKKQDEAMKAQHEMMTQIENIQQNGEIATKHYDFFISHATEDKQSVAQPLAEALQARGAKVWLDKFAMSVGDSLRKSIDEGLANSKYGIVILSEVYFKKFWTEKELNGLFAKQEDGEKVILPVWHNVSKDIVKQHSPILADMLALKTADFTIEELADEFIRLIQ